MISLLANIIWLITSFYIPIFYLIGAIILFPLLPFIHPVVKYSFLPFGRVIVSSSYLKKFKDYKKDNKTDFENVSGLVRFLANVIWVITFGWIIATLHIIAGILNFFLIWTIVAIPNIIAHFKMVPVAFTPFGRRIISEEVYRKLKDIDAEEELKKIVK